jgi:hypothetical protein
MDLPPLRFSFKMPSWCAWDAGGIVVFFAVAAGAAHVDEPQIVGAAHHVLQVGMAVVALTGAIINGVAIHAAGMAQNFSDGGE